VLRWPPAIIPDDPKIVVGDVRELRAAGAFPHGPDVGGARLQPPIDADVAARVQLDAGLGEADPGGVRRAAQCHQDVAARDVSLAGGSAHDNDDAVAGPAVHPQRLGLRDNLDAFIAKNPLHLIRDVGVLAAAHEPRSMLDDRDAAAEATVSLGQLEADIAAAEHDQMRRHIVELQSLDMGERPCRFET